jgi:hypothetical protein
MNKYHESLGVITMYTRSEIRHSCYRAKNGAATEKNRTILALVEPLLESHQRYENFAEVWDVIVTKNKEIKIVYPETDKDFIHSTLLKAQLYVEMGKSLEDMSDREYSLVMQIEQLMLEKVMTWENYNKVWGIVVDPSTNSIKTAMYNVPSNQIEVTAEMIEASKKDADGNPFTPATLPTTVVEANPMDAAQKKAFEEFLAKKYKG